MRPGELDRRWTILERSVTPAGLSDSEAEAFTAVSTNPTVWGSWEPLKGTEKWAAEQHVERAVARVRMRYRSDLTAEHRLSEPTLGEFEIIGEPEHRRRQDETVAHVSRIVQ